MKHWDISGTKEREAGPVSEVIPEFGADIISAVKGTYEVAHPFIQAPVSWMHTEFPEAVPEAHLDPYKGFDEEGTLFDALGVMGKAIGSVGFGGYSPEAPWRDYQLSPELMEQFLPLATEMFIYPTAAKFMNEGVGAMIKGARSIYDSVKSVETITEGIAGGIARVDELEGLWQSVLKEDEMMMDLGMGAEIPPHPGALSPTAPRVRQYTSKLWEEAGRKDVIPVGARITIRDQARSGMNRLRQRFSTEQEAMLRELEAAGVDPVQQLLDDPFNEKLYVTPDKFRRLSDRVDQVVRAELPPKQVSEIHERILPELRGDPTYANGEAIKPGDALKRRQDMARALNEGLPKASRITADEILQANKDPNLREKLAKLMARRITRQPWYKNRSQGWTDLTLLMRLGEAGFGAVTGGAIDEENRLRGAIAGAALVLLFGTAFRLGRSQYGKMLAMGETAAEKAEIAGQEILAETKGIKVADVFKSQRGAVGEEPIRSYVRNEAEAMSGISRLYLDGGGVEADITYGTGQIWKRSGLPEPQMKMDLNPQTAGVVAADATDLSSISDASVHSVMFDPPFVVGGKTSTGIISGRFGQFNHPTELFDMYNGSIRESARILEPGGKLIVKVQDTVWANQKIPAVSAVEQFARQNGLRYIDRFVAESKAATLPGRGTQATARSTDVHYLVFEKPKGILGKVGQALLSQYGGTETVPPWVRAAKEKILGVTEREGPKKFTPEPPVSYEGLQESPTLAEYVLKRKSIHSEKTIKLAEQIKNEGKVPMTQKLGFTAEEAAARKSRARVLGKSFAIAQRSVGMGNMEYRQWVIDTFGKGLRQMTEGEIVDKVLPALTQLRAREVVGAAEMAKAQKIRALEDRAMELYGAKAQQRIDKAIKKVTGVHRNLRDLSGEEMESVLEVLPKRFLTGRGAGALKRSIFAVEDVLNKLGPWGKHIARTLRQDRLHTEYLAGKWISELQQLTKGLSEPQLQEVVAALHPMKANGYQVVPPSNERLMEIATRLRNTLNEVGGMRKDIGDPVRLANGREVPFELMENYYPIHVAPEEWLNSINIRRKVVDHLIESGQASGPTQAEDIFEEFIQGIVRNKFGNLDFAREAWVEPERFNLVKDLSRYYYGAAKRLSRHMFFGRTGASELPEKVEKWLDLLQRDVNVDEYRYARKAIKRQFKHESIDDAMHDMLKRVRSFETVAHMGLASIMNSSEPIHTAVWAGFGNFMKGVGSALRSTSAMDAREIVVRTAASLGSTMRDLMGEAGGAGSLTGKFLKGTGFTGIESWNRRLAGHVGIHYVKDIVRKLEGNPASTRLRKSFEELLLDPDAILERGITEEELIKGAMEVANRTQKRTQVIDLPMFMSNPYGRILTMFKTFAYGAARLMARDVVTSPARLARMLVAFPIVGELVGDVRALATGNWRDTEGLNRLWENYMYVGTMGIAFDFLRSVQFGESSIKSFLLGPVGSDFAMISDGLYKWLAEGKGRMIGKQAIRMLPPPGTLLRGYYFPSGATKKKWTIG